MSSSSGDESAAPPKKQKTSSSGDGVLNFDFKKKRVRVLSSASDIPVKSSGIVYWMSRDCRVHDNWALIFSQRLALKNQVPLHVCFSLVPRFLDATIRHFTFLLSGLEEVQQDLQKLNISFHLLYGSGGTTIPDFVKTHKIGGVVCDFSPLRVPRTWVEKCGKLLPKDVPLCQVDAHNIVPVWEASDKQEYSARTIRSKINRKLNEYLQDFPELKSHPHSPTFQPSRIDWKKVYEHLEVDTSVGPVSWAVPGYRGGMNTLDEFLKKRIGSYDSKRNDPNENALSNLSPWFHFGHISVQR